MEAIGQTSLRGEWKMGTIVELIRTHRDEILQSWRREAGSVAAARGLSRPQVMNIVPRYLASLSHDGLIDITTRHDEQRKLIESHLSARLREGFYLAEILDEFALLGRCIARTWGALPRSQWPESAEVEQLQVDLGFAFNVVTEEFAAHMARDEQAEKHYLRRLRGLIESARALRVRDLPDRELLGAVLALVLEGMEAIAAVLVLYDAESKGIIGSAMLGPGSEELRASALARAWPLSSEDDAREDPRTLVASQLVGTDAEPGESFRKHGIGAITSVRLAGRHRVLGALYVAGALERTFTARDARRIESLGEYLILQLDTLWLDAELRDTAADLRAERTVIDQISAMMAHDLRGPLAAVRLNAQKLLRQSEATGASADIAKAIVRSVDRANRMVADLLDAQRLRAGKKLALELGRCDLRAIARDVVAELPPADSARVSLRDGGPVEGIWSGEELRRAVWNLVTNAVKYGEPGTPIVVSLEPLAGGVALSVHNEGPPIPRAQQATLFEPFKQVDESGPSGRHGWGLGLTLVRGCAVAHGGSVTLVSDAGQGTTFTIRLPWDATPAQRA